jgi:hypothetical protein
VRESSVPTEGSFCLLCFSSLFYAFIVTPVEQSYVFRAKLFAECFQYRLVLCSLNES